MLPVHVRRGLQGCLVSAAVHGTRWGVCLVAALDEALSIQFPAPHHFRQHHNGVSQANEAGVSLSVKGKGGRRGQARGRELCPGESQTHVPPPAQDRVYGVI